MLIYKNKICNIMSYELDMAADTSGPVLSGTRSIKYIYCHKFEMKLLLITDTV